MGLQPWTKTSTFGVRKTIRLRDKKDGTIVQKLRIEKFSKYRDLVMYAAAREDRNRINLFAFRHERSLMYEQLAYYFIEYIVPIAHIERVGSDSRSQIFNMYSYMKADTLPKGKDSLMARDVLKTAKKSSKKIQEDKEYVTKMLLNVRQGEEFWYVYETLEEMLTWFSYKFDDGHVSIIVK